MHPALLWTWRRLVLQTAEAQLVKKREGAQLASSCLALMILLLLGFVITGIATIVLSVFLTSWDLGLF